MARPIDIIEDLADYMDAKEDLTFTVLPHRDGKNAVRGHPEKCILSRGLRREDPRVRRAVFIRSRAFVWLRGEPLPRRLFISNRTRIALEEFDLTGRKKPLLAVLRAPSGTHTRAHLTSEEMRAKVRAWRANTKKNAADGTTKRPHKQSESLTLFGLRDGRTYMAKARPRPTNPRRKK